jgi:hypothetical protein
MHGVPAPCTDAPWPLIQKDAAVRRGPHPSAAHIHTSFLLGDMLEMVKMGFWLVLPYSALRHETHLCIAPSGVVPQCDHRPRPIMDYTFNGVNQASADVAPNQAMQFGGALQRLLQRLAYCNPDLALQLPPPPTVTEALVTTDNLAGHLNNSELELAAAICGHATQLATVP